MNELGIARAIAAGELPSPTTWLNSGYYRLRISGVGTAWRPAAGEFVYRPPDVWLSDEMCERVRGLPVISEHPDRKILDGANFYDRIVGICTLGFVEGDELWAIVRIIDTRARAIIDAGEYDTSPAVLFLPEQNSKLAVEGDAMLIEENPALLDHVALVATIGGNKGVWTRAGDEPGVEITAEATL